MKHQIMKFSGAAGSRGAAPGDAADDLIASIFVEIDGEIRRFDVDRVSGYRLYSLMAEKLGLPAERIDGLVSLPPI